MFGQGTQIGDWNQIAFMSSGLKKTNMEIKSDLEQHSQHDTSR